MRNAVSRRDKCGEFMPGDGYALSIFRRSVWCPAMHHFQGIGTTVRTLRDFLCGGAWLILLVALTSHCERRHECIFGPGECENVSAGSASGAGGTTSAITGSTTTNGAGGNGITTTVATTGSAGGASGGSDGVGSTGSTDGGLPNGCDPPGAFGRNCAQDVCGDIPEYFPGDKCMLDCADSLDTYFIVEAGPAQYSWVFGSFDGNTACASNGCSWSYVIRAYGKGCARATVSDGLFVSKIYGETVCGVGSVKQCAYGDGVEGTPYGDLRFVVTVDPVNVPIAGWLMIESQPFTCAGNGWGCP